MDFISHPVFISVLIASMICEMWKLIDASVRAKKLNWRVTLETGGMPSSHATFVCAIAVSIGFSAGFVSEIFFLALGMAIIVVRDAFGVRRAVDNLTKTVNKIIHAKKLNIAAIMKIAGHTPVQAAVGVTIGVLVPVILNYVFHIF
ncbi:divergent PAP2 family protein [Candidatus Woesearchaeota archaeon]|nr:divergent PAP2 family protein [Candidatus Woesearchaeota archaeon]